jgi:drug/metabolite transporter (DMT)-like permease
MIWGAAFIAQKAGNTHLPPIAFVSSRFLLSALVLLPFALREARQAPQPLSRHGFMMALGIGALLFVGGVLQQTAMVTASVTHGGFLTALYVVLVPITTWVLTRERVRPFVLVACVVSITGAWLLTVKGGADDGWHVGDIMLILSDIAWAFWISLIGIFLKNSYRPYFLAALQSALTGGLAFIVSAIFEEPTMAGFSAAIPAILFTGIISGSLAFTLQIIGQRYTPPAEAALIMSLESVFAFIAGSLILGERLTPVAMLGCVLIFAGVVIAETGPALVRRLLPKR